MANLRIQAILPRGRTFPAVRRDVILADLRTWGGRVHRRMATYPPQQPTVSGYRRTGSLGRNWKTKTGFSGSGETGAFAEVTNSVSRKGRAYSGYVEGYAAGGPGERQTAEMARRGWPRVDEVGAEEWDRIEGTIADHLRETS